MRPRAWRWLRPFSSAVFRRGFGSCSFPGGLGPLWETRKAYWADRSSNEANLRTNLTSLDATRQRHLGTSPHPEKYDPDAWTDEFAFPIPARPSGDPERAVL